MLLKGICRARHCPPPVLPHWPSWHLLPVLVGSGCLVQDVQRRWPAVWDAGPGTGDSPPPVFVWAGDPGLHRGENQTGHPRVLAMYRGGWQECQPVNCDIAWVGLRRKEVSFLLLETSSRSLICEWWSPPRNQKNASISRYHVGQEVGPGTSISINFNPSEFGACWSQRTNSLWVKIRFFATVKMEIWILVPSLTRVTSNKLLNHPKTHFLPLWNESNNNCL